jgi:CheY-like chemotaxis protein
MIDGWQVWDALRDMADGRSLNVVVLTGDDDSSIHQQAQVRHAVGLAHKPVHPGDLLDLVCRALAPA